MATSKAPKILSVESGPLIAGIFEDLALELEVARVERVNSCANAFKNIRKDRPSSALLGQVLIDGSCYTFADHLLRMDVPFVFTSGTTPSDLPARFHGCRTCGNPIDFAELEQTIRHCLEHLVPRDEQDFVPRAKTR